MVNDKSLTATKAPNFFVKLVTVSIVFKIVLVFGVFYSILDEEMLILLQD